jgi:hypothetical protein
MLGHPAYPALLAREGSDNATGADNQQERLSNATESSEAIRQTPCDREVKRWSDLHGDMQS